MTSAYYLPPFKTMLCRLSLVNVLLGEGLWCCGGALALNMTLRHVSHTSDYNHSKKRMTLFDAHLIIRLSIQPALLESILHVAFLRMYVGRERYLIPGLKHVYGISIRR